MSNYKLTSQLWFDWIINRRNFMLLKKFNDAKKKLYFFLIIINKIIKYNIFIIKKIIIAVQNFHSYL
jgi:hypothetical protein